MTRSYAGLSVWLGVLVVAIVATLMLKDAATSAPQVDLSHKTGRAIAGVLQREGFSVRFKPQRYQSSLFIGTRGDCHIAARDGSYAAGLGEAFRFQMSSVGPVRYVYRGGRFDSAPDTLAMLYRLVPRSLDRFGVHLARDVPIVVATSAACPAGDFGLDRITVTP